MPRIFKSRFVPSDALHHKTDASAVMQCLKRTELKDELYMQLVKQTRGNPIPQSRLKAWELFDLMAAAAPPSKVWHSNTSYISSIGKAPAMLAGVVWQGCITYLSSVYARECRLNWQTANINCNGHWFFDWTPVATMQLHD